MLNDILNNTTNPILPLMRVCCYGGAIFLAGRKVAQGLASGAYFAGSKVANYMNQRQLAESLKTTGNNYLNAAKKNLSQDLNMATELVIAGLAIAGLGIELAENTPVGLIGMDYHITRAARTCTIYEDMVTCQFGNSTSQHAIISIQRPAWKTALECFPISLARKIGLVHPLYLGCLD